MFLSEFMEFTLKSGVDITNKEKQKERVKGQKEREKRIERK
jgi:hypothetical protein